MKHIAKYRRIVIVTLLIAVFFVAVPLTSVQAYLYQINFNDLTQDKNTQIPDNYGSHGGVNVSYQSLNNDGSTGVGHALLWTGYADLNKVAISAIGDGILKITLTGAGTSGLVTLNSFQVGAYQSNLTADVLKVLYGGNVKDYGPLLVSGSTALTFSPGVTAHSIDIELGKNWDIGVNNIHYTAAPLPASLLLLGSGLIGLVGFRKKLKK
jgi:hypothetical protein